MEEVPFPPFEALRPHFEALARTGYYKIVPKPASALKNNLHIAYQVFIWIVTFTYNMQHVIRAIQVRHNSDDLVNTLFILLTTLSGVGKALTFNIRRRRIDNLIDMINGTEFAPQKPYHDQVMKINSNAMHRMLKYFLIFVLISGFSLGLFPFVNRALGEPVEFTGYFPFDTDKSPVFELIVAYMNIYMTHQGYGQITIDCIIVSFYAQVKVQLQILRYNLENLIDYEENGDESNVKMFDLNKESEFVKENLQRRFISCVTRHQQIMWFKNEVESIFAEALMFQLIVTMWVVCMIMYKLVRLDLRSMEFLSRVFYLCCIVGQLFMYCYYGTQVKYESEFVNQSLYCSDWLSVSPGFRRQIFFMMENCKRPVIPVTARIIPITLETYIAVLKASYSLFTLLNRK